MEHNETHSEIKPTVIASSWDLNAFRGSLVAYQTDIPYYQSNVRLNEMNFGIVSDRSYAWNNKERGYSLEPIIDQSGAGNRALIDTYLARGSLQMRKANPAEVLELIQTIRTPQAVLQYHGKEESLQKISAFLPAPFPGNTVSEPNRADGILSEQPSSRRPGG